MQLNNIVADEINFKELFFFVLSKLWIIIIAGIICTVSAGAFSKIVMRPIYSSSAKIYVINRENKETTTISDLQTGTQLAMDYKILVLSRMVTEQVINNLNLDMTYEQLVSNITVNTPNDTRFLEIEVKNTEPLLAKQLVDSLAEVSAERMVFIMGMEKANIVESGNIPINPSSPNVFSNAILGGLIGVLITLFFILLAYISDDTIKSIEGIERYLGLASLGNIPYEANSVFLKNTKKRMKSAHKNKGRKKDSVNNEIDSLEKASLNFPSNEAYRTLRTNIQLCGKRIKTICITSCTANEGKTVTSFRLASSIAASGKKVLFIDADLRKSVIIGRLKIDKEVFGLSQYLSGLISLDKLVNNTNVENVDIIFTGPIPPNPSELLESEEFKNLIMTQRELYDYVIIDTPPLGVVIDSAIVAENCDGLIMVIESNKISYKFEQQVLKQLRKGKCQVLGAVLNKVNVNGRGYYKKYYKEYCRSYKYES